MVTEKYRLGFLKFQISTSQSLKFINKLLKRSKKGVRICKACLREKEIERKKYKERERNRERQKRKSVT